MGPVLTPEERGEQTKVRAIDTDYYNNNTSNVKSDNSSNFCKVDFISGK